MKNEDSDQEKKCSLDAAKEQDLYSNSFIMLHL